VSPHDRKDAASLTADWTVLGIAALLLALVTGGAVSALLSWRLPMTPLASAVLAAGTIAGFVLLFGRVMPALVVLVGGFAAAGAGLLYDRALIPAVALLVIDALLAAATAALALPLFLLRSSLGLQLPSPVLLAGLAILVALFSMWLRRSDRVPGYSPAIAACVAAVGTLFAVWRDVLDFQAIWWLAALAATCVSIAVISRARATPLGATGTSYLALTIGVLLATVLAFSRLAG
jgi:hypothetical protein